jgi:hypothetical protein
MAARVPPRENASRADQKINAALRASARDVRVDDGWIESGRHPVNGAMA